MKRQRSKTCRRTNPLRRDRLSRAIGRLLRELRPALDRLGPAERWFHVTSGARLRHVWSYTAAAALLHAKAQDRSAVDPFVSGEECTCTPPGPGPGVREEDRHRSIDQERDLIERAGVALGQLLSLWDRYGGEGVRALCVDPDSHTAGENRRIVREAREVEREINGGGA